LKINGLAGSSRHRSAVGGALLSPRLAPSLHRRGALRGAAFGLLLGGLATGCALPPACEVKPADVEAARLEAAEARTAWQAAAAADSAELATLEAEIARLSGESPPVGDRAPLVQRLLELKRGSGR